MDWLSRIVVFGSLGCLALQMVRFGRRAGCNPLGRPPIARPLFLMAKLAAALSLILLMATAARGGRELPVVGWVAFLLLMIAGVVLFSLAFRGLGSSLRMGLPEEKTALVTSGVFAVSRNPLYLSLYLVMGASLIFAFSWVNAAAVAITVLLHHRIILAEEKFLEENFPGFVEYRRKVRRYL